MNKRVDTGASSVNKRPYKRLATARMTILLTTLALWAGLVTSLAAENSLSALQEATSQDNLLSIAETRALLQRGQERTPRPFTFEAALILVTEHRGSEVFQQAQQSINVAVSRELRLKLLREPVGCLVRVSGVTSPHSTDSLNFVAQEVLVVDREHRIEPMAANIEFGHNTVPLNKLAREEGRVKEVLWTKTKMRLLLSVGHHSSLRVSLFAATDIEDARQLIGAQVSTEGCLSVSADAYNGGTAHEILMITASQLKVLEPPSRRLESLHRNADKFESDEDEVQKRFFTKISGVVAYSNGANEFAVVRNQQRYLVRSNFASHVEVGSSVILEGWHSWNKQKDIEVIQSQLIHGFGKGVFLVPEVKTPTQLLLLTKFPSLVTLRGHVVKSLYKERTCLVTLEHDGIQFNALIGFDESRLENRGFPLIPGTLIDVTGVPIRNPMGPANTRSSLRDNEVLTVLVGSPDNVKTIERTMSLSRSRVAIALGAIALAFALTLAWTYSLRRQVESRTRSLAHLTSQMQTSFDAMREAVLVTDADGCVVQANRRFRELFGVAANPGYKFETLVPEIAIRLDSSDAIDLLRNCQNHSGTVSFPIELLVQNTPVHLQVYTGPISPLGGCDHGRLFVFDDVTEQRQMQAKLTHAQKMEAVGQLSGGIAHDFNNFLSVISASLAAVSTSVTGVEKERLLAANIAISRAAELTQQLLGFARRSTLHRRILPIHSIIDDVASMMNAIIEAPVSFQTIASQETYFVNVDSNRIQQVLINLCLNAYDEVDKQSGEISISTYEHKHPILGESVCIRVSDNGPGISSDVSPHIFEPFFTTKDVGEGTGLGLSVAQGVVEQHGGLLQFKTYEGVGTHFDVILPLAKPPTDSREAIAIEGSCSRKLRILLVDDDKLVRDSVAGLLASLSHSVVVAENGMQAILSIALNPTFDLVLLDLMMPEMSGWETYQEIKSAWPGQYIVFCSGYSEEYCKLQSDANCELPEVLEKPFRVPQLDELLNRIANSNRRIEPPPALRIELSRS